MTQFSLSSFRISVQVYHGSREELPSYLTSIGFTLPSFTTSATLKRPEGVWGGIDDDVG